MLIAGYIIGLIGKLLSLVRTNSGFEPELDVKLLEVKTLVSNVRLLEFETTAVNGIIKELPDATGFVEVNKRISPGTLLSKDQP
ncbi:hypothetical protein GU926_04190 [Nibribacter ruber]|uniref:Uncharacterized protein n=1 Tax=Nibribacter ruber TaxID=2698458 RepID=A0A6P1NWT2_9BACT|nr:hypothetical protein [Nibribacter ruber]QHL86679.1 hypothetical protein GU926_04190 [Nibribacter ruber]